MALSAAIAPAFINLPGPTELLVILVIVLVIFGPKKLPEFAKAIGQSAKELRKSTEAADDDNRE